MNHALTVIIVVLILTGIALYLLDRLPMEATFRLLARVCIIGLCLIFLLPPALSILGVSF